MEREGVIKYSLDFKGQALNLPDKTLAALNICRTAMIQQALLGQDARRYAGYGFGNISLRCTPSSSAFYISGTQTGHETKLSKTHLAYVTGIDIEQNTLIAQGETEPSSEGMTHGVLYRQSEQIQAVVHVHSPDIWQHADALNLPSTPETIPYGTPEMARAVQQLCSRLMLHKPYLPIVFVMKGHKDGVVAAGASLAQCTKILLEYLGLSTR